MISVLFRSQRWLMVAVGMFRKVLNLNGMCHERLVGPVKPEQACPCPPALTSRLGPASLPLPCRTQVGQFLDIS